ncbi:28S ribosomal protein S15, mitochondrial-like [Physeter macrocephalus]|uniref:Small ribosomal subunit protein uS15m n=1 Tax=Physeter macrocephalus TaxID=9755 RepID=A0A2Y9T7N9_PHYMC|nr:28S ribosomal protein S15, mitochondrial-like [Physeter catodon]|eukprot:XP_023986328.1 28S ribosomal protein S15, mitochondrial-like [Physeter catodon]
MLRVAWRALSSIRTQAVTQAPVLGLPGGGCAQLLSIYRDLPSCPGGLILRAARGYATQKPVQPSHEDDPPPSLLLRDYQDIPGIEKDDDVIKKLLSLEMANQKEKLKIKKEQLMSKVVEKPKDTSSLEAQIVALTVKIRKRYLLMSIDQGKKMLKNLCKTNYAVFEKTCRELGIEYTFPPLYYRKTHRCWVTKKALCIRVFQEAQKLEKQNRALKAAAAAARKQGQKNPESPSKTGPEAIKENQ